MVVLTNALCFPDSDCLNLHVLSSVIIHPPLLLMVPTTLCPILLGPPLPHTHGLGRAAQGRSSAAHRESER